MLKNSSILSLFLKLFFPGVYKVFISSSINISIHSQPICVCNSLPCELGYFQSLPFVADIKYWQDIAYKRAVRMKSAKYEMKFAVRRPSLGLVDFTDTYTPFRFVRHICVSKVGHHKYILYHVDMHICVVLCVVMLNYMFIMNMYNAFTNILLGPVSI